MVRHIQIGTETDHDHPAITLGFMPCDRQPLTTIRIVAEVMAAT